MINPAHFDILVRDEVDLLALELRIARQADRLPGHRLVPRLERDRQNWLQAEQQTFRWLRQAVAPRRASDRN